MIQQLRPPPSRISPTVYMQMASLLAVATTFIGLWTHFTVRRGGLICETKLPMQELELKSAYNFLTLLCMSYIRVFYTIL